MSKRLRLVENMHIPLWLIKDTCWMLQWKYLGAFMIAPTLSVAIFLAWKCRYNKLMLFPNIAICFWIVANSMWMLDEFFGIPIKHYSLYAFGVGFVFVFLYFADLGKQLVSHGKELDELEM